MTVPALVCELERSETIAIFPRCPPCVSVGGVLASSRDLLLMTITPPPGGRELGRATVTSLQVRLCSGPVASGLCDQMMMMMETNP